MNSLLEKILEERKGHYCHALEVHDTYELESIVESVISEYREEFTDDVYIEFFESMELYYLGDDPAIEKQVYDFSFEEYIR
jgi:hypothetical protein